MRSPVGRSAPLGLDGIRALLEQIMFLKVGDRRSFAKNLEAFCDEGFASQIQRAAISSVLDAGHASMHRMYKLTALDLNTALDIAEGIFAAIFPRVRLQEKSSHGGGTEEELTTTVVRTALRVKIRIKGQSAR
jgi:ABC-type molybdate transport system ATPase subunit